MRSDKKGAMEMSIGTIVVIVLSMSMLILGMVLVKNIFGGATGNILSINDKTKDAINNELFVENKRVTVSLPNRIAKIKQDEDWGVAFGIQNLEKNDPEARKFSYEVVLSDPDATDKCGIGEADIQSWIKTGRADSMFLLPGDTYLGIVRFLIPEGAPLCTIRFHVEVTDKEGIYATDFFDVEVLA